MQVVYFIVKAENSLFLNLAFLEVVCYLSSIKKTNQRKASKGGTFKVIFQVMLFGMLRFKEIYMML